MATFETSHQCCIMRKAMSKEVGAGGRFDIFLDSGASHMASLKLLGQRIITSLFCSSGDFQQF